MLLEAGKYEEANQAFIDAGNYSDARQRVGEPYYMQAETLLEAGKYEAANLAFIDAGNYSDAKKRVGEPYYKLAEMLLEDGKYEEANQAFIDAGNYSDAEQRVGEPFYRQAETMREKQDWDGAVTAFNKAGSYGDALTQVNETYYQQADTLKTAGQYDEAYNLYVMIKGYKDVDSILENDDNIVAVYLAQFEVGNTVTFGAYEQDGNTSNGAEAIEWIVLANDGDMVTLISKYGLDAKPYNIEYKNVTWETCTLRKWLNNDFLHTAFTAEEQAKLETVTVSADKNPVYSTDPGKDTQDKVFLLSIDEANRYFASDADRVCMPTKTAVANGAYTDIDTGICWWWLRSPGGNAIRAADVPASSGRVWTDGSKVHFDDAAVRPVVVLRL